jgi:hypothetical protein
MKSQLTLELGPEVPFQVIDNVMRDLDVVLSFATAGQSMVDRNDAVYRVLRDGEFEYPKFFRRDRYWPGDASFIAFLSSRDGSFVTPSFESAVARELEELAVDRSVRVEGLSYGSPFVLKLVFKGKFITKTIEIIRDWKTTKRVNDANARVAEAFASNYEDQVRHEQLMRAEAENKVLGDLRISRDQLGALLTPHVVRSLLTLSGAAVEIVDDDSQDSWDGNH